MNNPQSLLPTDQICFGLDRAHDEASLAALLQRCARPELLAVLIPRLSDREITAILDFYTTLLRKHLQDDEYHRHFTEGR